MEILKGKDAGKQGLVSQVIRARHWILVKGLNVVRGRGLYFLQLGLPCCVSEPPPCWWGFSFGWTAGVWQHYSVWRVADEKHSTQFSRCFSVPWAGQGGQDCLPPKMGWEIPGGFINTWQGRGGQV